MDPSGQGSSFNGKTLTASRHAKVKCTAPNHERRKISTLYDRSAGLADYLGLAERSRSDIGVSLQEAVSLETDRQRHYLILN